MLVRAGDRVVVLGREAHVQPIDGTRVDVWDTGGRIANWLQAEVVVMATDLAEVLGGAIALNILFDLPLLLGGIITAAVSTAPLAVQLVGYKLGLTSRNKQRAMGVDAPPYGRVTTSMLTAHGDPIRSDRFIHPRVESEIAFLLRPRVTSVTVPDSWLRVDRRAHGTAFWVDRSVSVGGLW
jgi:hypothetical protein